MFDTIFRTKTEIECRPKEKNNLLRSRYQHECKQKSHMDESKNLHDTIFQDIFSTNDQKSKRKACMLLIFKTWSSSCVLVCVLMRVLCVVRGVGTVYAVFGVCVVRGVSVCENSTHFLPTVHTLLHALHTIPLPHFPPPSTQPFHPPYTAPTQSHPVHSALHTHVLK